MKTKEILIELEDIINSIPDEEIRNQVEAEFEQRVTPERKTAQIMITCSEVFKETLGNSFDELWKKEIFNRWMELSRKIYEK